MNPERWSQVKQLLAGALEQSDPAARDVYLSAQCDGQTTLRREVESLLEQTTGSLEVCADNLGAAGSAHPGSDGSEDPNVGRRVGAWLLGERLGAGGMGAVYLARRAGVAFQQTAAVKLLRRGTDTEEVLRRFRAERQILARLEHPNIARLLDGGETDDGLPFFVMEHVVGARVTDFAGAAELSVARRLELFLKICGAVQYAHQNLVVHRDLKPGNILVTREGEPKLLDFGIAKLLAEDENDEGTEHTLPGRGRLTPGYASPEQARGEPVTTASDVYALGALLYELLAGRSPHRFSTPRPPPAELARVIGQHPPARLSVAAAEPAFRWRLRGDLDNIVGKALEKEPARRYPTVNAMAEDVRRHLDGRPVRARPVTWRYAAGKFIERNRFSTAAAALLAAGLLAALGATVRMARVARRERDRAERRFQDVRRLAHSLLFEVDGAMERGPTAARQLLVRRALENLDSLASETRDDPGLRRELATAYRKVGDVQSRLNNPNVGDTAGALASYRKALALRAGLLAGSRDPADARALAGDHGRLGDMLSKTGDTAGALAAYRRAVELLELHPAPAADREAQREVGRARDRLGDALWRVGDFIAARRQLLAGRAERLALAENAPAETEAQIDVVRSSASLGYLFLSEGNLAGALELYRANAATGDRLVAADPANLAARRVASNGHEEVGFALAALGDPTNALPELRGTLAMCEEALARDPANMQARNDLADVLQETGDACRLLPDPGAARDLYQRATGHYLAVAAADPLNVHARREAADAERRRALTLGECGDPAAAVAALRAILPRFEDLAAGDPANVPFAHDRARCLADLGAWLVWAGDPAAGNAALAAALPLYDALARRAPRDARIAAERAALRGWGKPVLR